MQDVYSTLPIGTIVRDRYIVEGLLGKGGFGAVYLVRDRRVKGNVFALKEVIDPSKPERARFTFESEILRRLDHPALPRIYHAFEDEANMRAYMLMDYIDGPNLETLRQKQPEKRFPLSEAMGMMAPIFDAVGYLHNQQPPIIHRDIKPANIIVHNMRDQVMLVDFGIAKEYDPDSTTTAIRRCSPGYGAPEQYSRGTNTRTDIYGLGATFYALLSGVVPEDAFYRMTQLGSKDVDPLVPLHTLVPGVPQTVSAAIQRALSISSGDRYPSVQQFWQALNAYPWSPQPEPGVLPLITPEMPPLAYGHGENEPPVVQKQAVQYTSTVMVRKQVPPEDIRKRRFLPLLLLLIIALAIGLGVLAVSYWSSIVGKQQVGTTPTPRQTQQHVIPLSTLTSKPTRVATATPTSTTPPVTPTTVPSSYPNVTGTHYGQVHNTNNGANASLTIYFTENQRNGTLGGYVTIGPPLQGSGPIINGFVQKNNYIQFTVQGYKGNAPLFFTGTVFRFGKMSGSYCSLGQNGYCSSYAGGQGTWYVGSSSSSSSFSSSESYQQQAYGNIRQGFVDL